MNTRTRSFAAANLMVVLIAGLTACSGSGDSEKVTLNQGKTANPAGLVGRGCADYASQVPTGAGSVAGMAQDPLATAAGHNPMLTQLTAAVSGKLNSKVNLANTLNGKDYTVLAPVDDAFAKLPASEVASLRTNTAALTKLLTYHVIAGQLAPGAFTGKQTTVEGQPVTVTGSGDNLKVNGATVICGGVKTANATVYMIDSVLTPPAG